MTKRDQYRSDRDDDMAQEGSPPRASETSDGSDDTLHEEDEYEQAADESETNTDETVTREQETETVDVELPQPVEIGTVEMESGLWEHKPPSDVRAQRPQSGASTRITIPTTDLDTASFKQETPTIEYQIRPLSQDAVSMSITTVRDVDIEQEQSQVEQPAIEEYQHLFEQEESTTRQGDLLEMDEDPIYVWTGGVPYGVRRPCVVIHLDDSHGESFAYLKRVLRDEYKSIRGGEPTAEHVEFVANKPKLSSVSQRIVMLDVQGPEWNIESTNQTVKIERHDSDITPDLERIASTTFTGDLGYFIIKLPADRFDPLTNPADDFIQELRERLTPNQNNRESEERMEILTAKPKRSFDWKVVGSRYFGLDGKAKNDVDGMGDAESMYRNILYRMAWEPVSLTELQSDSDDEQGESDEHYLSKAALVDSIAYHLYIGADPDERYGTFVNKLVAESEPIQTEVSLGETQPDIRITASSNSGIDIAPVYDKFLQDSDWTKQDDLAIELETGRQQAAFNYRKIRATIEKYRELDDSLDYLAVVIPPALLHMGESRARTLQQIVEEWNELDVATGITEEASLFIPQYDIQSRDDAPNRPVVQLSPAADLIEELYPDDDE